MKNNSRFGHQFVALLAVSGFLTVLGCSDDGLGARNPVSGTVTYKGEPLAKGTITFMTEAGGGRGAMGEIKDGKYTMTTQTPGDGAFAGTYGVTIVDLVIDAAAATKETNDRAAKEKKDAPVMPDQAAMGKALANAKNTVPPKYQTPQTSGLKAEVKSGSNTLNYDLVD